MMILSILRILGVDRAIGYGVLTRVWGLAAGPLTILMVATRMSKEQQGFYYTFSSLLALQIFFELGLTTVIAQFASHESAFLTWTSSGAFDGDPVCRERLSGLLCKSVRWYGVIALLLLVTVIPCGLLFLGQNRVIATDFSWRIPWILAVMGTAANLLTVPFFAVILGSGDVATVNQREMLGAIAGTCASWLVLLLGGGLYAIFTITFGNAAMAWWFLFRRKRELVGIVGHGIGRECTHFSGVTGGINWWSEIWPMQWKIAVSWASGYFIFQLFTPVLFHYHGAVVAGQMGITLSASTALLGAAYAWQQAKSPVMGKLVAVKDWQGLDNVFFKVFWQSFGVVVSGATVGWAAIALLQAYHPLGSRFIQSGQVMLLLAAVCVNTLVSGFAVYLRAHKKDPFMVLSLVIAGLQGVTTWYLGMKYSSLGVTSGFLLVSLVVGLPAAYMIWRHCRKIWHVESVSLKAEFQ